MVAGHGDGKVLVGIGNKERICPGILARHGKRRFSVHRLDVYRSGLAVYFRRRVVGLLGNGQIVIGCECIVAVAEFDGDRDR